MDTAPDGIVYYWVGGAVRGRWQRASTYGGDFTVDELRDELRRFGYVAHKGSAAIGPPEGPPPEPEIASVLRFRV